MAAAKYNYALLAASTVALLAVAASNALFAYELGGVFVIGGWRVDGILLAAASIAAAVFQATLASTIRDWRQIGAIVMLALCLGYSLGTMASHVLKLQRVQEQHDDALRKSHRLALERYEDAKGALDRIGPARPLAEIAAEIDRAPVPAAVRARSRDCSDISQSDTRAACAPLIELYAERGRAEQRARLAPAVDSAREELGRTSPPPALTDAERMLRHWLPWIFAVVLELLETFGFALSVRRGAAPVTPETRRIHVAPENVVSFSPPAPSEPKTARAPARGADALLRILEAIESGALSAAWARVAPDGYIVAGQADLGAAAGVSKTTVNNWIAALVASGRLSKRSEGRGIALKIIRAPANNVVSLTA